MIVMSKIEKQTILIYSLHNAIFALFTSFLNIYLFTYTNSFIIMALFVAVRMVPFTIATLFGGKFSKVLPYSTCMIIGLVFVIISLVFSLEETELFIINPYYSLIVAFLCGIGFGLTWFVLNNLSQVAPSNESRSLFISIRSFFNNLSSIVAPIISTIVLLFSKDDTIGYRNILIVVIVLCVILALITFTIKAESKQEMKFSIRNCVKFIDEPHKLLLASNFYNGFNDALYITLTGIMVSNAASNATLYSTILMVFAIISVIICRFIPFLLRKENIKTTLVISGIFSILSIPVMAIFPNMFGAIFYCTTNAIAYNCFGQVLGFIGGNVSTKYNDRIQEVISAKTVYNSLGRIIGMGFVVLCYYFLPESIYLQVSVSILSLPLIIVIINYLKLIDRVYDYNKDEE